MLLASQILAGVVAALHLYFLVLEMFLWTGPVGQRVFQRTAEQQRESAVLAANQGLYNGFLVAGFAWSFLAGPFALPVRLFFFSCVVIAGLYGGLTVNKRIAVIQAGPAIAGLVCTWLAR